MQIPSDLDHVELHLVESFADAKDFNDWFLTGPMQHGHLAVDTETTGLSRTDTVRLVQIGDMNAGWAMQWDRWSGLFVDAMERYKGDITMFNAIFDYAKIKYMGVTLDHTRIRDVLPRLKMLEPDKRNGLKPASSRHVDPSAGMAQKELDEAIKKLGWGGVPCTFGPYWQYGAMDPVLTIILNMKLRTKKAPENFEYGYQVENAVLWVLNRMMERGIPVDVEYAREQRAKITQYSQTSQKWIKDNYGVAAGSNQAVVEKLMEYGFEFSKTTQTGLWALDKEVLEDIDHPLARTVLKRRQLDKIGSTYLDHYINHSVDGRVHPSINPMGARTGRMSVSDPNFQNLPRVSEGNAAASVVRNCVVAGEGNVLLFCDFSQIETRLLAHLSEDEGLIAAFHSPEDFFVTLARRVFKDETIGKKDYRRNIIKTFVYATIYGAGVEKQAKTTGLPVSEMQQVADAIHAEYPGIKHFQALVQGVAKFRLQHEGKAYFECPMSGRIHIADPGKEYALVNHLIQGMAAFFFKTKLLELDAAGLGDYMILPVHDEVILELPITLAEWAAEILINVMNDPHTFRVPVAAEVSYGYRWGEKKDWSTW